MTDADLLARFKNRAFTEAELDHRTHVKLAFLLLRENDFDTALVQLRDGLREQMAKLGLPDSPLEGYNETTTHAFLQIIHVTMHAYGKMFAANDADAFCGAHPQLMNKHLLRCFYSPECRQHPEAKAKFVEPDLAPLPRWVE